jgi:hypothetical protein
MMIENYTCQSIPCEFYEGRAKLLELPKPPFPVVINAVVCRTAKDFLQNCSKYKIACLSLIRR